MAALNNAEQCLSAASVCVSASAENCFSACILPAVGIVLRGWGVVMHKKIECNTCVSMSTVCPSTKLEE